MGEAVGLGLGLRVAVEVGRDVGGKLAVASVPPHVPAVGLEHVDGTGAVGAAVGVLLPQPAIANPSTTASAALTIRLSRAHEP
ncbi:MAG TPA: hypothetical protein VMZ33_01685 [Candidatus Limnocylindrales bacterium]|nr:hypothetical protein [Candidatus Limnocylindrales bacterium]